MRTLIASEDLVTRFYTYEGVVQALNRISLDIADGLTFGLVGESGCGKSVFVRSLMRIVQEPGRIKGGKVLFFPDDNRPEDGIDLLSQPERYMEGLRGEQISMIFQEPNAALNPIMSIGDQVAESFLFHRTREMSVRILSELEDTRIFPPWKALLKALYQQTAENPDDRLARWAGRVPFLKRWKTRLHREALRRSIDILTALGISQPEEIVKRYPHNLSGGMKQRVVIAMALACSPLLLIADEATSNLDVTIQAQILDLLTHLKKTRIASVLMITHDLGVVAQTCDRVGVMYAGNLCEVADVRDLFTHPRHPYTHALLTAVPKISDTGPLASIEGSVPNLVDPPPGCRFHPRCPQAGDPCREAVPPLTEMGSNHLTACYFPLVEATE